MKIRKIKFMVFSFVYLSLPEPYDTFHLKNHLHMSLDYVLSSIKFCDPSWLYSIYVLD
jgi:hypothetical protein